MLPFNLENKITWMELAPSLQELFKNLQSQIITERDRAIAAERVLDNKINAEKNRATGVEGGLDDRITELENSKGSTGGVSSPGGGSSLDSLTNIGDDYWYGNINGFFAFAHLSKLSKDGKTIDFTLMDAYYIKDTYSPYNNGKKGSILDPKLAGTNVNKEYGFQENFPYPADGIIHVDVTREILINLGWVDSSLFVSNITNTGFRVDFDSVHEHDADIGTRLHIHYLAVFFGDKKL